MVIKVIYCRNGEQIQPENYSYILGISTKNKCCPLTFYSLNLDDSVCCQHTASPLGNGAIVETSDKRILVLKRSDDVGEFPGHFVFPGGHPEVLNGTFYILFIYAL